uniref:Uncharacterized protein n=1 Tax=Pan troglodytes TaxID=9598 RepID=A0A2I3T6I3_PANTR
MDCQNGHQHISQELIHMQLVTVQFTQLGKGALEVIQVLYGISQGSQHLLAMCLDLGVAHDGRGRGQVAKAVKEPLGPWVDNQDLPSQGFSSSIFHIHLAPQACDSSLVLLCEMTHGVWTRSLLITSDVPEATQLVLCSFFTPNPSIFKQLTPCG